jgi:hypothetical protein
MSSDSSISKSEPASADGTVFSTAVITLSVADPPVPVQVIVKVLVVVILSIVSVPDVLLDPDQPPEALQVSALLEDQVKVTVPLQDMDPGPSRVTVGLSLPQSFEQDALVSPQSELHFRRRMSSTGHRIFDKYSIRHKNRYRSCHRYDPKFESTDGRLKRIHRSIL